MPLSKPNAEKLRAKRDVAYLIEALTCEDPTVSLAAAGALGEVGDARAVRPLLAALESGNPELRARAVEALGRLGNSPFFTFSPAQFAELENDPDRAGELKMLLGGGYAIRVLEPDEVEALARELRESGVATRLIALLAAEDERLGGVVATALGGEFGERRRASQYLYEGPPFTLVADVLKGLGESAIEPLLALRDDPPGDVGGDDVDSAVRTALRSLGRA